MLPSVKIQNGGLIKDGDDISSKKLCFSVFLYFAPSLRCCLVLLLKFIGRKTINISNRNFVFFKFEYASSYYDIQINLKTPKHLILAFNLTEIGTS
jgi:hypothetical protein